jgi:hypothetical protein
MSPPALLLLGFLVAGVPLSAQTARAPQGFSFGFGLGYGGVRSSCDSCGGAVGRVGGTTASVTAGKFLTRSLRLGGALDTWIHSHGGATEDMANASVTLSYAVHGLSAVFIPDGLLLVGGIGVSTYHSGIVRHVADTVPGLAGTGWGYSFGLGYDLRLSKHLLLNASGSHLYGRVGDLHRTDGGGGYTTGWNQNYFDLTLGVTFQP